MKKNCTTEGKDALWPNDIKTKQVPLLYRIKSSELTNPLVLISKHTNYQAFCDFQNEKESLWRDHKNNSAVI